MDLPYALLVGQATEALNKYLQLKGPIPGDMKEYISAEEALGPVIWTKIRDSACGDGIVVLGRGGAMLLEAEGGIEGVMSAGGAQKLYLNKPLSEILSSELSEGEKTFIFETVLTQ